MATLVQFTEKSLTSATMENMEPALARLGHAGQFSSHLHDSETDTGTLVWAHDRRVYWIRLIGTWACVLMSIGAVGAGALPVLERPTAGVRVFSVFLRTQNAMMTFVMIGMVVVVFSWLLLGRYTLGRTIRGQEVPRLTRGALDRILLSWMIPLAIAPPMFSKDVYSYLAHGAIAAKLSDPYSLGPASALGVEHPLVVNVPDIWRDTANQYGPFFLTIERGVFEIVGNNSIAGLALHRVVAMVGIAMLVWAVPRLAGHCGVSDVAALWLAVGNPLVLFHLVSGVHSEALMMGLLACGCVLVLDGMRSSDVREARFLAIRTQSVDCFNLLRVFAGIVFITAAALIKLPAAVALGFMALAIARGYGGGKRALVSSASVVTVIAVVVTIFFTLVNHAGIGWITKLGAATTLRSWISPPTAIGMISGEAGQLLGLGDHSATIIAITQGISVFIACLWTLRMLYAVWRKRIHPIGGLGLSMGAVVVLFPVVHPWYLLWALIPLAAWANKWQFRAPVVALSALVAVFTLPLGTGPAAFVTVQSLIATVIAALAILAIAYRRRGPLRLNS